jgi:CTP synthase
MFCNVKPDCVIENLTIPCLYDAPVMLHKNGLDAVVCRELNLDTPEPDLSTWEDMTAKIKTRNREVKIAVVGKYVRLHDAYLSISEALNHAGYEYGASVSILWWDSDQLTEDNVSEALKQADGILIPAGSEIGASREKSLPADMPESTTSPSSESAWACRSRS